MTENTVISSEYESMAAPGFERVMVVITVMMVAVIEVLDMTIVSVALPHMMGAFGANTEQITWVVTSYIVSSAIVMLVTGFLIGRFGCRRLMFVGVFGFMLASIFCGLATSLEEIVVFRVLQGIFGAILVPLSQFVIRRCFSQKDQATGMAIWGMGIMVAPILGPTLGGYITDTASWRWIFYINVPICLAALFLASIFIKETERLTRHFDWVGMLLMGIGVGALQLFLDRGNSEGWFESTSVQIMLATAIVFLTVFIVRGLRCENHILNLKIFRDRNFTICSTIMALYCGCFFGVVTIQPIMLERLMGYPATLAGLVTVPRGITSAIAMALVARLIHKIDPRWAVFLGLIIAVYSAHLLSTINLDTSFSVIFCISAIQGFATGLFFVPLGTMAFTTLSPTESAEATGVFSFSRNLGISMGTAALGTVISRESQINWNVMGGHISVFNPNLDHWLQYQYLTLKSPEAVGRLANMLGQQSGMLAYLDAYWLVTVALLFLFPTILLLRFRRKLV